MKDWLARNTGMITKISLWAFAGIFVLGAALDLLSNLFIVNFVIAWVVTGISIVVAVVFPLYMRWVRPKLPAAAVANMPSLPRLRVGCVAAVVVSWIMALLSRDSESSCSHTYRGHRRFTENTVITARRMCLAHADFELMGSIVLEFHVNEFIVLSPSRIHGIGTTATGRGVDGRDAAGGEPPHCRDATPERDLTGAPSWCTTKDKNWEDGAKTCNTGDLGRTCDVGYRGSKGLKGGPGPIVRFVSERMPDLSNLTVELEGGSGGRGGNGGRGTNLYWIPGGCEAPSNNVRQVSPANSDTQSTHTCPPGAEGEVGDIGVPGECHAMRAGSGGNAVPCATLGAFVSSGHPAQNPQNP